METVLTILSVLVVLLAAIGLITMISILVTLMIIKDGGYLTLGYEEDNGNEIISDDNDES